MFSTQKSAFKQITNKPNSDIFTLIQIHTINLNNMKKQFLITQHQSSANFPLFIRYFLDILLTLQKNAKEQQQFDQNMEEKIIQMDIPLSLVKQIFKAIQAKLPQSQTKDKLIDQISRSMLFQNDFFDLFKSCMCQQKTVMNINKLKQFYNNLKGNFSHNKIMQNIYNLHGGSLKTIQRNIFTNNVKFVIYTLGKNFTTTNNFINRNFKLIKKQTPQSKIIDSSTRIICNYQNSNYINNLIKDLTQIIFQDKQFISKNQFFIKIQSAMNHPILWLYSDLLNVEVVLLQTSSFRKQISKRQQVTQTNFYTQQMQKLLKKCPFNGDERCKCKKCHCVRRNRESAKLSQQKKRDAVQKVGPLQQRVQYLQKRNKQLEEENTILKTLMSQLKNNPDIRSFVQPINKVFNDS